MYNKPFKNDGKNRRVLAKRYTKPMGKYMNKLMLLTLIYLLASTVHAGTVGCEDIYVKKVWVQSDREDGSFYQNKLVITFKNAAGNDFKCGGSTYAFLDISSQAYQGILSIALSALVSETKVKAAVNTGVSGPDALQLAYIRIAK